MAKTRFNYRETVDAITSTNPGQERNMYPSIKDLMVYCLGHESKDVFTDTRIDKGGVPDVFVNFNTLSHWIVVEAKDERGIFKDASKRQAIFAKKYRYVGLDTEWFLFIDPECIVVRRVNVAIDANNYSYNDDKVLEWGELTSENRFNSDLESLSLEHAKHNNRIIQFRNGDESLIATIKLKDADQKELFLHALRLVSEILVDGFSMAVSVERQAIIEARDSIIDFMKQFPGSYIVTPPFSATEQGKNVGNKKDFIRETHNLRKLYHHNQIAFRIANEYVLSPTVKDKKINELLKEKGKVDDILKEFVAETVNLTMSRILMLRFFEDHGFFGKSKRYLCNGGVAAFQLMRQHFQNKYPSLLKIAYEAGSRLYEAIFGETILDWILRNEQEVLSIALERAMFYLSEFDFTMIKEDVLSRIYVELIPPKQRKDLGQHFTPPSIARYLVKRTGITHDTKFIDAACGLGTFLVEGYHAGVGLMAKRRGDSYNEVSEALDNIRGNDINTFSATITQMQILWSLLEYKKELVSQGFPLLMITGGFDSLRVGDLFGHVTDWSAINDDEYDVVVGNPPFVRAERQEIDFGKDEQNFYETISHKIDYYSLFVYKAMTSWLKNDGLLGFVLPLSFCDNDDNHKLRQLFALWGKWKIIEIMNLEELAGYVFPEGAVCPILLVAKKAPAEPADTIILRHATSKCLINGKKGDVLDFDLSHADTYSISYADAWSEDGRILPKMTPKRKQIVDAIHTGRTSTFTDIAMTYWVGYKGSKIEKWALSEPQPDGLRWKQEVMICRGSVFRSKKRHIAGSGLPVYKGENITPCLIDGPPVETNIDVAYMDDPSLWKYINILPHRGYAFHRIALTLQGAPFDPHEICLLDSATLFIPAADLESFPFDFLVLSSLYQWYIAVTQREGILALSFRADFYPSTIARLPWSAELLMYTNQLKALREDWLIACREKGQQTEVFFERLAALPSESLNDRFKRIDTLVIKWPGSVIDEDDDTLWYKVQTGPMLFDYCNINDKETAEELKITLPLYDDLREPKSVLKIELPLPEAKKMWNKILLDLANIDSDHKIELLMLKLDRIVADCFNVADHIDFMKKDIEDDSLFRRLKLKLPYSGRKFRGLLKGIDKSDRYDRVT